MAASQAANVVDRVAGHRDNAITAQDASNPAKPGLGYSSDTMKALAWQGKNKVEVIEVPKPKILENTDVILKITGSTVCGSDLHLLHGAILQLEKGDILGHEFCGVVDSVGSSVSKVKAGDRVVCSFQIACGHCYYCERKLSSQCARTNSNKLEYRLYGGNTAMIAGYSHLAGGMAGGQSEYTRVPLGDVNLLKLPDNVPDEKGLYISDVLVTSYHCVVDTGVKKDDVVGIWGAGPIGQMAAAFALNEGASRFIMIDSVQWRLDLVKEKNGSKIDSLNFAELASGENVPAKLKEMVGEHGLDVALECVAGEYPKGWLHTVELAAGLETDTSEILNEMTESVKGFGRVGVTGVYAGITNHFNIGAVMERGIRFIGNGQAPVHLYWHKLLEMIQSGEIDPLQMVSHRVRVEDLDTVYHKFDKKEDRMQKVFVQTRFSDPRAKGTPELTTYG